jgi:ATP:ADP antiporter, AAA family
MSSESMQQEKVSAIYTSEQERHFERLKLLFLWLAFFFIIGSYTVIRELRDSIFAFIVGREYISYAKTITMFAFIPAIFLYSKLVDKMRRYYLLCAYSAFYAICGFLFAYFLGDSIIGIPNTSTSPDRIIGWLFYFFVEGFSPFVVSVFWAFLNSVSSPETAKNYGFLVSGSKVGGMLASASAWYFLSRVTDAGKPFYSDTVNHQILIFISSLLLLCVPIVILWMMRRVPGRFLHGYEAVYQIEKEKVKQGEAETGVFAGLKMLIKYPYVLGIFGMVFFYEVVTTVLSVMRVGIAQDSTDSMSGTSAMLFAIIFVTHAIGFLISLIGTSALVRYFGEKRCLMLIPATSGLFLAYFMMSYTDLFAFCTNANALVIGYIGLKAINYAFSYPVRESLYIPTVKEIKFKSKSWIDAFGSKFGKTSGATFTMFANWAGQASFFMVHVSFFGLITLLWMATAYLLGRRFEQAVRNNEVIGIDQRPAEGDAAIAE